jgi:hypothetical protein
MTRDATTWHCAHIYYYDDDKDGLLLDGVRPLIDELAPDAKRVFFVRHWRQGPHIRLCVSAGEPAASSLRPRIDTAIGRYLAEYPSRAKVDEAQLLAIHRTLAAKERETGPLTPLQPDNSIHHEPYDRRLGVLGTDAAAALLERFYHETTPIAFDMLARVRAGDSRLTIALDLMLATAHAQWPDIRRGFISYRSHAEGLIVQSADPVACRAFCRDKYRSQGDALKARLLAILDDIDHDRDTIPFVRRWVDAMAKFREAADPLIASGAISFAGTRPPPDAAWDPEMLKHSEFHRTLQSNASRLTFMREDPGFLAYRLMLNYLYLHLGRIGIRPIERLMLCYLAAEAVEEQFGVSARELVAS